MVVTILLFITSLVLILVGANYLVDGASAVARKCGLSELLIGLTIVGIGTSAPEMVVSFIGAFNGNSDIALGNIVGSNIFNTAVILGLTAVICPVAVSGMAKKRDIPFNLGVSVLLAVLLFNRTLFSYGTDCLSRIDGAILLVVFIIYMFLCFKNDSADAPTEEEKVKEISTPVAILMLSGGLAALIFGGKLFVNSTTEIARAIGVSDAFIAITVVSFGTSLPELATAIIAAVKGKTQMALGDIVGSNISNILLILGGSALIHPLEVNGITPIDFAMMLFCALFLFMSVQLTKRGRFSKLEGIILLLSEAVYFSYLVMHI
ncbi:MAG: calcium/sodium antiporter [Bacteroidaceae bacterium]|nr:calcium/sodium antiporter [Bacteroidales bacterium]MCF0187293.1 calcium/sodium antiporter [Bacteroidaceae bacterium]